MDVDRKTILVTGSTDGVGKLVARGLAAAGARLLLHGRNREKGDAVLREIRAATGSDRIELHVADLASLQDVRRLGADFRLVGPVMFLGEIRDAIIWEAGLAVVLSFAANFVILRIHFVTWRRVWLVMLPVAVGTILSVGAMGILRLPFNFFNVAGIALIFGFGVDYGIYVMQAHVEGVPVSGSGPAAISTT